MSVLESTVERRVVKYAKSADMLVFKLNNAASSGWMDRMFLWNQRAFFIEFKRKGEKPRKLQDFRIATLLSRGYNVYVVDNIQEGENVINYERGNCMGSPPLSRASGGDYGVTRRSRTPDGSGTGED